LNPRNGEVYWRYPRAEQWDQTVATPIFDAKSNQLIVCSDREGATALQLDPAKPGFHKLWESFAISALHSTPVLRDGFVYGINHNGAEANHCGEFRCVELASGRVAWAATNVTQIGRFAQAHVTLNTTTDTFYISNELGELVVAKASPKGYHQLARAQITGKTWSHPAYAEGKIYARSETSLVCVSPGD
jgi:hypothetical protein